MWFIVAFVLLALSIHVVAEASEHDSDNILARFGRELVSIGGGQQGEEQLRRRFAILVSALSQPLAARVGYAGLGLSVYVIVLITVLSAIKGLMWLATEVGRLELSSQGAKLIDQGGIIGVCIIGLGIIGLSFGTWRALAVAATDRRVSDQLRKDVGSKDSPLGRLLVVSEKYRNADEETIERKLSEAVLKEIPTLTKGVLFVRVVSVVAPAMGLLGTVTGMLQTFHVVALYGAGDPKLLAESVTGALVTTVLGLVVAIPMLLIHFFLKQHIQNIVHALQFKTATILENRLAP